MITNQSLDKKYTQKGWNYDKEIKYRSNSDFEKDLVREKELSKKVDKKLKKDILYKWEVVYHFHEMKWKIKDYSIEYKSIILEAYNRDEAKKKFENWNKERVKDLKEKWIKNFPPKGVHIIDDHRSESYYSDSERWIRIHEINKVKE